VAVGRLIREQWVLDNLRKLPGVQIDVLAVDTTNVDAMKSMFRSIDVPVAGVVFLAVSLADSLCANLTAEKWDHVYNVKVNGLQALQQAIDFKELDWVVLCSSMATVFGSPGQVNYTGAQTILERIAESIPNCIAVALPPILDGGEISGSHWESVGRHSARWMTDQKILVVANRKQAFSHEVYKAVKNAMPLWRNIFR
jgi:KR domain